MNNGQSTMVQVHGKETDRLKIIAMPDCLKLQRGWVGKGGFNIVKFEELSYLDYPEFEQIVDGEGEFAAWNPELLMQVVDLMWDGAIEGLTPAGKCIVMQDGILKGIGRALAEGTLIVGSAEGFWAVHTPESFDPNTPSGRQVSALLKDAIEYEVARWDQLAEMYVLTIGEAPVTSYAQAG